MKNRITAGILAMLMLAATSCGGTGDSGKTDVTTEIVSSDSSGTVTEETDGLDERNMNGFTLSLLHHTESSMSWTVVQLEAEEQNGELVNDAIYDRNRKVEERFNCKINVSESTVQPTEISQLVMSGDTTYDILLQRDCNVAKTATYLMDWNEIPYIKFNADWWYPQATDLFRFNNKLVAAANSISLSCVARASGFAFNKEIYDEISGGKSLYDYVYEDKWTLDNFHSIAKAAYKDLNGNGEIDTDDRFGIGVSSYKETFARLINGAGVSYLSRDTDGNPIFTLDTDEISINKLLDIYKVSADKEIYSNTSTNMDDATSYGSVIKNTALFVRAHARLLGTDLRDSNVDCGIVPNPKYDEDQDRYYSTTFAFEIMTLPKTLAPERYENVGIMLEALAFDSHKNVLERYKEDAVKIKYTQDDDSFAMLDIIFNSISFDLGLVLWEGQIANPLLKGMYANGSEQIMSTFASQKNVIEDTINEFLTNFSNADK